jgi:small conductance mechanosensitive channel
MLRTFPIAVALVLSLLVTPSRAPAQASMVAIIQEQQHIDHLAPGAGAKTQAAPTTEPAGATTQPTTQPAQTGVHAGKELGEIDLIKVIKGEKSLTVEQIFQLGYWVDFGKDFVFGIFGFIPKLFAAVFLFAIFWIIYLCVRRVVIGGMTRAGVDQSIRDMLSSLLKWAILGFGLVIAGNQIGIQIAALLTGVSIIGLAVGFAAQETLANFIAGIVIFWDKPFRVGDWVEIDSVYAQVQRVTFRSTRLLAGNGDMIVMPNTVMLASKLRNRTTNPKTQVKVSIGIAYKESIEHARAVLLATTVGDARLCVDPAPSVTVAACADSAVNLALSMWTQDESMEGALRGEYLEKAKNALDAAGISIPFPHVQLLLEPAVAGSIGVATQQAPARLSA